MSTEDLLAIRVRERVDLLDRIVDGLRNDRRVHAAWLSGSVSRGDDDGLSDLDLSVVVADEGIDDVVDNPRLYVAQPPLPVLVMDNLANAPHGGAYLLALYSGGAGPQHVDWFWQPESNARIPDDEKTLFDHVGLPKISGAEWRRQSQRPPGPPLAADASRSDLLTHKITFFWAMSLIVAKSIARRDGETVARMTRVIATTLTETLELLGSNLALTSRDAEVGWVIESETPSRQFEVLYSLAQDATDLHAELTSQGADVPKEAMPHIQRFFELTESIAAVPQ